MATATQERPQTTNAPAVRQKENGLSDLQKLLETNKSQIAMALPKHLTPERMIRMALSAASANPKLLKCNLLSVAASLVQCSILGLEPNTPLGEAYIIPYWNTKSRSDMAQMQTGYQGLVKLAYQSGQIEFIDAQPVHEVDEFDFAKGTDPFIIHKPPKTGARGKILGYYGLYIMKGSQRPGFEYMTVEEIEEHRDKYSQGAYKKEGGRFVLDSNGDKILQGPWKDSPDWMYRKTPLRQALKLAPKSIELRAMHAALKIDEAQEAGVANAYIDVPLSLMPPAEEAETHAATVEMPQRKSEQAQQQTNDDPPMVKSYDSLPDAMSLDKNTTISYKGQLYTNGDEQTGWSKVKG